MALNSNDNFAGGPALRMGPLHKIDVSAEDLARRAHLLLKPPPS